MLLAALAAIPSSSLALAQDGGGLTLVNHNREFVEHMDDSQHPVQSPLRLRDMRGAKRKNGRTARDVPETKVVEVDAHPEVDAEARELTEQGLRILARLAVRAYLRREMSPSTADPGEHFDNPAEGQE